jgi:hypothetical protein
MKRKTLLCSIMALSLVFSACAKKFETQSSAPQMAKGAASYDSVGMQNTSNVAKPSAPAATATKGDAKLTDTEQQKSQTKIIRNASLYIVEENLTNLSESIRKKVEEIGGYVENENLMEQRLSTRIRIPAEKFDEFIGYTEKGFAVKNKTISSENITDVYVDNEARLRNLKAQEEQILTILKKANTVEEVLKVQAELYRIRGEAEALEARKKNWDKQVDYATININADKKIIVAENKNTIISGSDFFKSIGTGFTNTAVTLVLAVQHIVIFFLSNIIVLAILALGAFFGIRYYKKYMKRNTKE